MNSRLTTSRAYWNLRAEQVMDRVFHDPEVPMTTAKVHIHDPVITKRPSWQVLSLAGLATTGLISSLWLAHNWQGSQAQLARERNLLLIERIRKLPTSSQTTAQEPGYSLEISKQNQSAELTDLPPPPDPAWIQALEPVTVPVSEESLSSNSSHFQQDAAESVPVLVGVVHGPRGKSSAIFEMGQTSTSAIPGENIGSSDWRVTTVSANGAVIERQGKQRRLNIGGAF
ncbi:MAG: pilus assembly protein PilZ [Prochlorococcus sp.]|nr:pilus assembly protein PilZ [Prochlorococcaceae cyanobacterium ETNP14_MAG_5]